MQKAQTLLIKLEPVCKGQLQKRISRFSLLQSQGTEMGSSPSIFVASHAHREVSGKLAGRKAASPSCALENQALRALLRTANKRSNQEKEPEAINWSMDQIMEFVSNYVRIWTVGWGHGGESKELEQETGGIKDGR